MRNSVVHALCRADRIFLRATVISAAFLAGVVLGHNAPRTEQVAVAVKQAPRAPAPQVNLSLDAGQPQEAHVAANIAPVQRASFAVVAPESHEAGNMLRAMPITVVYPNGSIAQGPGVEQTEPSPAALMMLRILADQRCLAEAMYYEARGEGVDGQKAIAEVVFHRMHARGYPHSICGVVYEGASAGAGRGCQFSFACNGDANRPKESAAWFRARTLAAKIMSGLVHLEDMTQNAIAFHASDVQPEWGDHLERTIQIGNHIFYRAVASTKAS